MEYNFMYVCKYCGQRFAKMKELQLPKSKLEALENEAKSTYTFAIHECTDGYRCGVGELIGIVWRNDG